jgi:hypothetical protein
MRAGAGVSAFLDQISQCFVDQGLQLSTLAVREGAYLGENL